MKAAIPKLKTPLAYLLSVLLVLTTLPNTGMLAQNQVPPAEQGVLYRSGSLFAEQPPPISLPHHKNHTCHI
jgi:hypothetical protein